MLFARNMITWPFGHFSAFSECWRKYYILRPVFEKTYIILWNFKRFSIYFNTFSLKIWFFDFWAFLKLLMVNLAFFTFLDLATLPQMNFLPFMKEDINQEKRGGWERGGGGQKCRKKETVWKGMSKMVSE